MFQRSPTFVMDLNKNWNLVGGGRSSSRDNFSDLNKLIALYSENSPPTEIADKLFASIPHLLLENGLAQRQTDAIIESDK